MSEERKAIVRALMDGARLTPKEIALATGKKVNSIHFLLHKMKKDNEVRQSLDGKYYL
jgi:DNA-binding IclR family transcriptional regulator